MSVRVHVAYFYRIYLCMLSCHIHTSKFVSKRNHGPFILGLVHEGTRVWTFRLAFMKSKPVNYAFVDD